MEEKIRLNQKNWRSNFQEKISVFEVKISLFCLNKYFQKVNWWRKRFQTPRESRHHMRWCSNISWWREREVLWDALYCTLCHHQRFIVTLTTNRWWFYFFPFAVILSFYAVHSFYATKKVLSIVQLQESARLSSRYTEFQIKLLILKYLNFLHRKQYPYHLEYPVH